MKTHDPKYAEEGLIAMDGAIVEDPGLDGSQSNVGVLVPVPGMPQHPPFFQHIAPNPDGFPPPLHYQPVSGPGSQNQLEHPNIHAPSGGLLEAHVANTSAAIAAAIAQAAAWEADGGDDAGEEEDGEAEAMDEHAEESRAQPGQATVPQSNLRKGR